MKNKEMLTNPTKVSNEIEAQKIGDKISDSIVRAISAASEDALVYGTGAIFITMRKDGFNVNHVPFAELKVDGKPNV